MHRIASAVAVAAVCLLAGGCGAAAVVTAPLAAIRPGPTLEQDNWRSEAIEPITQEEAVAPPLRVMSFNLRVRNAFDLFNGWAFRRALVLETIDNFQPDILGTQEGRMSQIDELQPDLENYAFVGVGRDDGDDGGETTGIFYRADRFEEVDSGHFWLSDTPDEVASRSWGNLFNRMATWVRLRDTQHADRQELVVFNTHFDAFSAGARRESAKLLRRRIEQVAGDAPVITTGDFNAGEGSRPYELLIDGPSGDGPMLTDAYRAVHPERTDEEGTIHGFRGGLGGDRIDWILTCDRLEPVAAAIDRTRDGRRYPSDHFPVAAVVVYRDAAELATVDTDR